MKPKLVEGNGYVAFFIDLPILKEGTMIPKGQDCAQSFVLHSHTLVKYVHVTVTFLLVSFLDTPQSPWCFVHAWSRSEKRLHKCSVYYM